MGAGLAPAALPPPAAAPPPPAEEELTPIASPLVGTFYRASSPDADPFVSVGARVNKDTVVCIIEAMKVMNEIKAETSGVIKKILVENATAVQFGQPMFLVEKG
jgi:acetyl-CoA carboxylase biotin carboxyl carrier protein